MYPNSNDLPSEVKREILIQIRSQIGELEYQSLVGEFGEDGLIDQVVAASRNSQAQGLEQRALTLGAKELKFASKVRGSISGLALGGLFAFGAWVLHAGFGVPYWDSVASLFYSMPLVLCIGFIWPAKKADFRFYLFLLSFFGLVGGLIGACRWGCGSHGSISGAIFSQGEGVFFLLLLVGCVLWAISWGKVVPWEFAGLWISVLFGIVAVLFVLVDAPQDPVGVSKLLDSFLIAKLVVSTSLFGFLLGSCFPIGRE